MKRISIKHIITFVTLALFLSACGGDSDESVDSKKEITVPGDDIAKEVISMSKGETTEIQKGDTLEPSAENTRINVKHYLGENSKYVTIIEGSATLSRSSNIVE